MQAPPKRLRPWEQHPEPQSPDLPHSKWPQEFKELCKEFNDVLVNKLEYAQNINYPPMEVELQPGVKPFFTRKPQKRPIHWAEKVKKEVKKLIKVCIIKQILANEQAQWINPAGFFAKDEK